MRATKHAAVTNWIINNINADYLIGESNIAKCEYVISKIPSKLITHELTIRQIYPILYKNKLITSKVENQGESRKEDRKNWLQQHQDEILSISYPTSKQTNRLRIQFTMDHMNNDLNTNYSKEQIRNFLNHQHWIMKHGSNSNQH